MNKEIKGTLLAIFTAIISGFAIPVNKLIVINMDPTVFTAVRSLILGLVFLGISWKKKKLTVSVLKDQKWMYLILIGLIGGGIAFLLYFNGLELTTSARGAFLHKTLPFYTTVLAFFFLREKMGQKQLMALGIMFLGTIFIYYDKIDADINKWPDPSFGDLLIILATFLWAVENTIAKKTMIKGESNFVVSAARMFIGSLLLFTAVILFGKIPNLLSLSLIQILGLIVSTVILFGYVFCWYSSIKLINVSKASTILLISPVISMVLGIILFEEPTPLIQLGGSVLILLGAYLISKVKSEFIEKGI
ncbi:MAG: EamA family transporter [Candidatus Aenigmarchaeota archaeon]|nr:EamA family transporter [Candidatus Aenigmarchaeota archaeon]